MRLIDGDELLAQMVGMADGWFDPKPAYDYESLVKQQPTVDAAPVVHGRWETDSTEQNEFWGHYCNRCSTYLPYGRDWRPNYCPECGAKMDSEGQDAQTE